MQLALLTPAARRCVFPLAVVMLLLAFAGSASAQRGEQKTETKTGKIVEIQEKGRGRLLVVEIDGKQQNVPVTPKLDLEIIATGDAGFLRPGQFLTASATMSNEKLFIKALTIHVPRRGQKVPAGRIAKAEVKPGESTLAYDVSGSITATQTNKDYPDHLDLALKATGTQSPIMIEPGYTVTVICGDPERIPLNSEAEITVAPLRGGRFSVVGIKVQLPQPFVAAEFFGDKPAVEETAKPDAEKPAAKSEPSMHPSRRLGRRSDGGTIGLGEFTAVRRGSLRESPPVPTCVRDRSSDSSASLRPGR